MAGRNRIAYPTINGSSSIRLHWWLFALLGPICLWNSVQGHLNLYEKDGSWLINPFDRDCLFVPSTATFTSKDAWTSFCIRPEKTTVNEDEDICYGEQISFRQMQSTNITIGQLFKWNAGMKTIESYSKYLALSQTEHDEIFYCQCLSPLQFGDRCQYQIDLLDIFTDTSLSFVDLLENALETRKQLTIEKMQMDYVTCYVGIRCHNSLLCIDWRQICNGVIDCDQADDEPFELCSQMEFNRCDPETEFRCHNGMCIPFEFWNNGDRDCADQSDETYYRTVSDGDASFCTVTDQFNCEEATCPWKGYSCGDGQCLSYAHAGSLSGDKSRRCSNLRNGMLLKKLFSAKPNQTEMCWRTVICLTGFSDLFPKMKCSKALLSSDITKHCPDQFYFPPNPVVYSYVYFVYDQTKHKDWSIYTGPDFICYSREFCPNHSQQASTILINGLNCLPMNHTIFSWNNFYEYVLFLFSTCYPSLSTAALAEKKAMVFQCLLSNTSLSIHRLKDRRKDCYYGEDESPTIDFCSYDLEDKFQCLTNDRQCIRRSFVRDEKNDCSDGSDEHDIHNLMSCSSRTCVRDFYRKLQESHMYPFSNLCDGLINHYLFPNQLNETDETDCQHWPYKCHKSPFTVCDGVWNCVNGIDELGCARTTAKNEIEKVSKCAKHEHYCIQFNPNRTDIKLGCLHPNRAGDGIIDCIGATDEQYVSSCTKNYPLDRTKRFQCMNSSICIQPEQVCDRVIDCPMEDDELVCPWLYQSNASTFHCKNSPSISVTRCSYLLGTSRTCELREQSWFCDLVPRGGRSPVYYSNNLLLYPDLAQQPKQNQIQTNLRQADGISWTPTMHRSVSEDVKIWSCNHGYPVQSIQASKGFVCLCPVAFYGDHCQYQSERITVHLKIQTLYYLEPSTVFRLMIYLLNQYHDIVSYEEIVYIHDIDTSHNYLIYLLYQRIANTSLLDRTESKFVRIDSYMITKTSVQYISSWLFKVQFPFLPVNRLSANIYLEDQLFRIQNCKKKCGSHGKCMYYLNAKHLEYCKCDGGWFGERCHLRLSSDLCQPGSCAPGAQCLVLDREKKRVQCICPLERSGDQCYIMQNSCAGVTCENNGTCLSLDQRSARYECICPEEYYGVHCEDRRRSLRIFIPNNISWPNPIPAAVVIFARPSEDTLAQKRVLFTNIHPSTTLTAYGDTRFALIQMFFNFSNNAYYLIATQYTPLPMLNTTVVLPNRCQHVRQLFNATVLTEYSYLKRLKLYHLPCLLNTNLRCFFDEYRMCFCTRANTSDCFLFNHENANCDYCQNKGLCVQKDALENQWQFTCLCQRCSFGSLCQFSTGNYYITLDILVGSLIKPGVYSLNQQPSVVLITLTVLIVILLFSLIFNTISFSILANKTMRQVGCDVYLLSAIIISQIGLVILFLRFLYMLIIQIYAIENARFLKFACYFLEYSTRLIPSLFDWLVTCISIERVYTVMKDVHFTRLLAAKTLKISKWIVLLVTGVNILTTLHRPFFLTLVGEPAFRSGPLRHPWCILRFDSHSWNIYEKFINIFHLIIPILIHFSSTIAFLLYRTRLELSTSVKVHKERVAIVLRNQVSKYKTVFISPLIILLLEVPRFVLTFVYGCTTTEWHRHVHLFGYLTSYLPLAGIFFIYILPSPKYKTHFQTMMKNNRVTRTFFAENSAT